MVGVVRISEVTDRSSGSDVGFLGGPDQLRNRHIVDGVDHGFGRHWTVVGFVIVDRNVVWISREHVRQVVSFTGVIPNLKVELLKDQQPAKQFDLRVLGLTTLDSVMTMK